MKNFKNKLKKINHKYKVFRILYLVALLSLYLLISDNYEALFLLLGYLFIKKGPKNGKRTI